MYFVFILLNFMCVMHYSCHSCQKEFSCHEYSNMLIHGSYIKERCERILQNVLIVSACMHTDISQVI